MIKGVGQPLCYCVLVFLTQLLGRCYHLTRVNKWSDCIGYRIEIVCLIGTLSTILQHCTHTRKPNDNSSTFCEEKITSIICISILEILLDGHWPWTYRQGSLADLFQTWSICIQIHEWIDLWHKTICFIVHIAMISSKKLSSCGFSSTWRT